jgi:hypothetical protein
MLDVERLRKEATLRLFVIATENLPRQVKETLTIRLDTIISNYSETFLLGQLYVYLRMLHALRDSNQITEEQFRRLYIDPAAVLS